VANRETEKHLLATTSLSDYGEGVSVSASGGGEYWLISYVTSPLTVYQRQDYVVMARPDNSNPPVWPTEPDNYRWTIDYDALPAHPFSEDTDYGVLDVTYEPPVIGDVHVTVELESAGTTLATLTMDQTVQARDPAIEAHVTTYGTGRPEVVREILYDLRQYVLDASAGTGATGAPAALIAALLWQEGHMRYRDGTPEGDWARAALKTENPPVTGPPPGWAEKYLSSPEADIIREEELETVASSFNATWGIQNSLLQWVSTNASGKSIGVAQQRPPTAAMVLCNIAWREKPPKSLNAALNAQIEDQIEADYNALDFATRVAHFNLLRFPKSHIWVLAEHVAKLKNRPRTGTSCGPTTTIRYKNLTRQQMRTDPGCALLATEFNIGASNRNASVAKPNRYGDWVFSKIMVDKSPIDPDTWFPEPP
jgi:hypothetical protein